MKLDRLGCWMDSPLHLLTFRVAQLRCGIRVERVREILPLPWLTRAPGQPAILEGFLNLRGSVLPVVSAAALFDLPAPAVVEPHIVVLGANETTLGLLVDATEDVLTIASSDLHPLSAQHSLNQCAEAEFDANGDEFILLASDRLILAEETRRIADLQNRIERRLTSLETSIG